MGTVFVVGSINQDHMLFVDRRPRAGETVGGATVVTRCGGKGANQAVAAVEAGATVIMLGRVGADEAGTTQRADLARRGVDVSLVATVPGAATGAAFITVTPDGENAVTLAPGANDRLGASDVDAATGLLVGCAVLVTQLEVPVDVVARAVSACGDDTSVLLNAAPPHPVPESLLQRVDILVVNESEAAALGRAPVGDIDEARTVAAALLGRGPGAVIVTMGADGAVVATADGCTHVPAPATSVVDTTGAGDVFVGTLAALAADGCSLPSAVERAVAQASASVAFVGARRSADTPSRD
jgi:ribokinase